MLKRLIAVSKNKTLLFNWLPSSIRSRQMTTDSSDVCSSTKMVDISKLTAKKSHNLVANLRNTDHPLKEPKKLNYKILPPEKPSECCNNQCDCCVFLLYVTDVAKFYDGDEDKIEEALNCIPNIETQNYVRENWQLI